MEQVSAPAGILKPQSTVVTKCSEWIEKFKTGAIKKSDAYFKIHSILVTSKERPEIIKAAAESYFSILNQQDAKTVSAHKRGRSGPHGQNIICLTRNMSRSGSRSSGSSFSNSHAVSKKKKKVNESDLPWVVQDKLFGSEL
jgi:hypothetical protein